MIFEIEIGQIREVNRKIRSKIRIRNLVRITETGYYTRTPDKAFIQQDRKQGRFLTHARKR